MPYPSTSFILTIVAAALVIPAIAGSAQPPTIKTLNGTIVGSSQNGIDSFLGIPFAKPPTCALRLKPPRPIDQPLGTFHATGTPTACPQIIASSVSTGASATSTPAPPPEGEDCLTLNIQRPSNISLEKKLPVLFWIFGGAFQVGSTQTANASTIIQKSQALGSEIIYVTANYRANGFGFLAGKELQRDGSTNLGLRDQRAALQWVAENIESFGGDPDRVTIFGESAGSISVYYQLLINRGDHTYRGKPLFRGAIMDSGSVFPVTSVNSPKPQRIYNAVVEASACSHKGDTLGCLRTLPYDMFKLAVNAVPNYLSYSGNLDLSYLPRPDPKDHFFSEYPEIAAARGWFAHVPAIIGDQEDEGTTFALPLNNLTTTEALVDYLSSAFHIATRAQIEGLVNTYPMDPSAGSPFRTGSENEVYPQYKRIAALFGDLKFTLMRRFELASTRQIAPEVPWWSYLATYGYGTPTVGTQHGLDTLEIYLALPLPQPGETTMTYYISFVNHLDPNTITTASPLITWPPWTEGTPVLLNLSKDSNELIPDTFRQRSYEYLRDHWSVLRL